MIKNLSRREKLMLYLLLIVAIVAGGFYLLIRPGLDTYMAVQDELEALQEQQATMTTAIAQIDKQKTLINDMRNELKEHSERLQPWQENDELDHLLTGMLLSYELTPYALELSDTASEAVLAFGADADDTAGGEGGEEGPQLLVNYVNIQCEGQLNNLLRFTEDLAKDSSIELLSLNTTLINSRSLLQDAAAAAGDREPEYGAPDLTGRYMFDMEVAVYMSMLGEIMEMAEALEAGGEAVIEEAAE